MEKFNSEQLSIVNNAITVAEELVSDSYKLSASQWLRHRYEVKTEIDLNENEKVEIPFAQLIRYKGQKKRSSLGSCSFDYYKICLMDSNILSAFKESEQLKLFPFLLYIVSHELIHIVRFSAFLQSFSASFEEKIKEEVRVHNKTHEILSKAKIQNMTPVLNYKGWEIEK